MRKGTLITGIILVIISAAVVGYHLWDMEKIESYDIHRYSSVRFDAYFGTMTAYVTWSNNTTTDQNTTGELYTFYVAVDPPGSCDNFTGVVATANGSSGSLVTQFDGPHDWYAFLCDSSGDHLGFLMTLHQFAPTYYMVAGTGIGIVGAGAIVFAYFQPPAPPLSLKSRKPPGSQGPPPSASELDGPPGPVPAVPPGDPAEVDDLVGVARWGRALANSE
jgi:hypothetical protein